MTLSAITALPTAPSRSDAPSVFNANADAWVGALDTFTTQMNAVIAEIPTVVSGIDYNGTSTTSKTIATGSQGFTTQAGKNFQIGQSVRVAYTTTPANYMDGQITAYNSTTGAITVNVTAIGGTGNFALWTISLAVSGSGFLPLAGGTLSGALAVTGAITTTGNISPGNISNYYLSGSAGSAVINFDSTDYVSYNRTSNVYDWVIGGVNILSMTAALATFSGTVRVQTASGTTGGAIGYTANNLTFGNGTTQMTVVSTTGTQTLTNKTLASPVVEGGTINSAATVLDTGTIAANSVGFRGVPVSSNVSGTLVLADAGEQLIVTTNQTIPANASVAFPIGTLIEIYNNSAAAITVAITTDTLRLAGSATTGTRTVAAYGSCFLSKKTATVWSASGNIT